MKTDQAFELLRALHAPRRLITHASLVLEAAVLLTTGLHKLGVKFDSEFVKAGAVLHDAGKALHPNELDAQGSNHEIAGQNALIAQGVAPQLARVCVSHGQWATMQCSLEELLVALADKLWKGARIAALEERVLHVMSTQMGRDRWEWFTPFDDLCESIAEGAKERLNRSV